MSLYSMGKIIRLVICGASKTGKTSMLEHLIYGEHACNVSYKTIEDTYLAQIDTDRGVKETVRIQDTGGADWLNTANYSKNLHFGDGFILVYSITDKDSFKCVENIKKEIDKAREKKDISIVVVGNKCDLDKERAVDNSIVQSWATKEKIKAFEVSTTNRKLLAEPFIYLCSKMTQPPVKSTLLGSRRLKQQTIE